MVVGNTVGTDFQSEWDPEALAGPLFVDEVAVIERPVDDGTFDQTAFEGR